MALHMLKLVAAYHVTAANAIKTMGTKLCHTNTQNDGLAQPGCHLQ